MNLQKEFDFLNRQDKDSFFDNLDTVDKYFKQIENADLNKEEVYELVKLVQHKGDLYEDFDDVFMRKLEGSDYEVLTPELMIAESTNNFFDHLKIESLLNGAYILPTKAINTEAQIGINLPEYWDEIKWQELTISEIKFILLTYDAYTDGALPPYELKISYGWAAFLSRKLNGIKLADYERDGMVKLYSSIF